MQGLVSEQIRRDKQLYTWLQKAKSLAQLLFWSIIGAHYMLLVMERKATYELR